MMRHPALLAVLALTISSCSPSPKYAPGDVWTYDTRPGEEESRAIIVEVEERETPGTVVHLRLSHDGRYMVLTMDAIDRSVVAREGSGPVPDAFGTTEAWLTSGGVPISSDRTIRENLDNWDNLLESWADSVRGTSAKLPDHLPADEPPAPRAPNAVVVKLEVVCDEWGEEAGKKLVGHRFHWRVNGRVVRDVDLLHTVLEPHAQAGAYVEIEPLEETTYGDVARTLEIAKNAGFDSEKISFGGGLGEKRTTQKPK